MNQINNLQKSGRYSIVLIFCFAFITTITAGTDTFNGTTSSNWATPSNWSTGSLPASGDNVIIATGVTAVISPSTNVNLEYLVMNSGSTLTNNGTLTLTTLKLSVPSVSLNDANFDNEGILTVNSSGSVYQSFDLNGNNDITLNGMVNITAGNLKYAFYCFAGSTNTIGGKGFTIGTGNAGVGFGLFSLVTSGSTLTVNPETIITDYTGFAASAYFNNISLSANGSTFNNNGTISIIPASNQGASGYYPINLSAPAGGTATFNNAGTFTTSKTYSNNGAALQTGGSGGTNLINNTGTLSSITGSTQAVNFSSNVNCTITNSGTMTLSGTSYALKMAATIPVTQAVINTGTITILKGQIYGSTTGTATVPVVTNKTGGVINFNYGVSNGSTVAIPYNSGSISAVLLNSGGTVNGSCTFQANTFQPSTGTLAPGDLNLITNTSGIGKIILTPSVTGTKFPLTGTLSIQVNGTTSAGTNYDQLSCSELDISGAKLNITSGYNPLTGDNIGIVYASTSLAGKFTSTSLPNGWGMNYTVSKYADIAYSNAWSIDSLSRSGNYLSDGSYQWNYKLMFSSHNNITETLNISLSTPGGFPFTVVGLPASITENANASDSLIFQVNVPAAYITEPVNITVYNLMVSLITGTTTQASTAFNVRGPLPSHPRLFIRKSELATLKAHYSHPDFATIVPSFLAQRDYVTNGIITTDSPSEPVRQKMEAEALNYLLDTIQNKSSGRTAITVALNYLSSYAANRKTVQTDYNANSYTYDDLLGAAMVYDWCYPLMTKSQKDSLRSNIYKVCLLGEYGLPTAGNVQFLSSHYGESAPTIFMGIGIATFDEDPSFFDFEYNEQVNNFAPSRNPMFASGTHHQGAQYIHVRHSNELLQHFMLDKLGISPYNKNISQLTYRAVYGTVPQQTDMDGLAEGDGHNGLAMGFNQLYYLSANLSKDPYLQYMSKKYLTTTAYQSARLFVYHNPDIVAQPLDSLTLSRYFPSPSGIMIARTKWDIDKTDYTSNVMAVLMNMKEYNAQNHTHLDAGHFSIYYKGQMALDAGIYQGSDANNGWGMPNYVNYYSRTIAHNSLLVLDPNEPLPIAAWNVQATARDGGQFFFMNTAWNNSSDMFNAGKSSQVMDEEIAPGTSPDYSYLKGDITASYNVPACIGIYPPKVSMVRRSFVFLNQKANDIPGTLIVLDKVVSTNASFKKTWLLHTQNQPAVAGNVITAVSTQNGRNGKIQSTVLLPEITNQNIQLTGGAGKEYLVDGTNWGTVTQQDAGTWRVELSPKTAALSDNFMNVIQAMDATFSPTQTITKVSSTNGNYVAVVVKDRIVAEELALDKNTQEIQFTAGDANMNYKILVTDLQSGNWQVISPSGVKNMTVSASGTMYFNSTGGSFDIQMVSTSTGNPVEAGDDDFSFYPNPARESIKLKTNHQYIGSTYIISDMMGRALKTGIIGSEGQTIQLNGLVQGVYYLNISGLKSKVCKIMKQN